MVRDEMIARMTSAELSRWFLLFTVKGEEAEQARKHAGVDFVDDPGGPDADDEDEEAEDESGDGQTE